jgi:hypothetical protein
MNSTQKRNVADDVTITSGRTYRIDDVATGYCLLYKTPSVEFYFKCELSFPRDGDTYDIAVKSIGMMDEYSRGMFVFDPEELRYIKRMLKTISATIV